MDTDLATLKEQLKPINYRLWKLVNQNEMYFRTVAEYIGKEENTSFQ